MATISKRTVRWNANGVDGAVEQRSKMVWTATVYDRAGKRHRKDFKRQTDAKDWVREQEAAVVVGTFAAPSRGKETLRSYFIRWQARQVHKATTEAAFTSVFDNHVLPEIGDMRLDAITPADVQTIVKAWTRSAAPATVRMRYSTLATVMRSAVKERIIPMSPCEDVAVPRPAAKTSLVPITADTVIAMYHAMPDRYRLFVTLGAGAGMRRGEILGLTADRVFSAFGTIRVDRQLARMSVTSKEVLFVPPKTEASVRTIPVDALVTDAVEAHVEQYGSHASGLLLTSSIGTPLSPSSLHAAWTAAAKEVGTAATPHDLRHFFASVQLRNGTSIKAVQNMLGHKTASETLDTYGHLMGDEDDRARAVVGTTLSALRLSNASVAPNAPTETQKTRSGGL
jgi:integrase